MNGGRTDSIEIGAFYRDLITDHDWKLQPMLKLVERIAASKYSEGPFASMLMSASLTT